MILISILYIYYLAFFPFKTVVYNNAPFPVVTQTVSSGQQLVYTVNLCVDRDTYGTMTRELVGSSIINVSQVEFTSLRGCHVGNDTTIIVPTYTPAGRYRVEGMVCSRATSLQNRCQSIRTQYFEVE